MASTTRRSVVLAFWVVIAVMVVGCTWGSEPDTATSKLEGVWVLRGFVGVKDLVPSDPSVNTEITLKAGEATGFGGVNSFGCTYQASSDGRISFGELTATTTTGPLAATEQESKFFEALKNAWQFEIYQGDLVLSEMTPFGSNGLVVLAPKLGSPVTPSVAAAEPTPK